jgi:hypothetical protein
MTTNIPEVSADPMALITQQAPGVTIASIASFISTASTITIIIASAIPDGIQHDSPFQHDPPQFQLAQPFQRPL